MSVELILYGTEYCHLCEQAHELLADPVAAGRVTLRIVDVADDPALEERYGIRIPVVRDVRTGAELGWPFDSDRLEEFLRAVAPR